MPRARRFPAFAAVLRLAAVLLLAAASVPAAVPDRDWPSVKLEPVLDTPLRDTAITRGPDGAYYLTGTLAVPSADHPGQLDFENSHQIRLWRSDDLRTWRDIGVVWDLDRASSAGKWHWTTYWRVPLGPEYRPPVRGIVAPELHHLRGAWYLCFSINGQGTGLLRSTTDRAEGPYEEIGQITSRGGDPSLFWDDPATGGDDSVYWLTDGGWIARLTPDLRALAERPRLLTPSPDPRGDLRPGDASADLPPTALLDDPQQVGRRGAFMFKHAGRYFLCAADYNSRLGHPCDDTWIAYADHPNGPWSERHLMIPHGGGVTVFPGPDTTALAPGLGHPYDAKTKRRVPAPQLYAGFHGADERAVFRDRPAFLPLEWTGPDRWDVYFTRPAASFPRKPQAVFTEKGPWQHLIPLRFKEQMRDISILDAPDGWYYLTASGLERPGELVVYRSRDLTAWEEFKVVFRYDDIEWLKTKLPADPLTDPADERRRLWGRVFWDVAMLYSDGNYYIWYNIFPSERLAGPDHHGSGVLRSTTGRPEGPYESLGRKGGHYALDPLGGAPRIFTGADGRPYANAVIDWRPQVAADADLANTRDWRTAWDFKPVDLSGAAFASDGWGSVHVIHGKYVFIGTRWGGPVFNPHVEGGGKHHGTYDFTYATGPTPWGPFGRPHPMSRNGGLFRDKAGAYWMIFFGNDGSGPWWQRPGLVPLSITDDGRDIRIDLKMPPYTDHELRVMGAGSIAEVRPLLETLVPAPKPTR